MTQSTPNTQLIDSLVQTILTLSDPEIELFINKLNASVPSPDSKYHPSLKQDIEFGLQQLRNGQYSTYTSETLPTLLDTIKQRGKQRLT